MRCAACNIELTLHQQYAGGVCDDLSCRRKRVDAQLRAELIDLRQLRDVRADQAGLPALRGAPVVSLSWYETGLEPVPPNQRAALREYLMSLQDEVDTLTGSAGDAPSEESDMQPPLAPAEAAAVDSLLAQVCARCTGHCCRHGNGRHAFLDAEALRQAWLCQPESSFAELVDSFLADIPELHHVDSCVFHGERGCALPRDRRAEMCNRWECPGLREARQHAESGGATRFFVARGKRGEAFAADFVPSLADRETGPD